jgi:hypothetical protein
MTTYLIYLCFESSRMGWRCSCVGERQKLWIRLFLANNKHGLLLSASFLARLEQLQKETEKERPEAASA